MVRVCAAVIAVLSFAFASPAFAGNAQRGDNGARTTQDGTTRSGDAIGGPGLAVIRRGDVRLEMTHSPEVDEQRVTSSEGTIRVANPSRPTSVVTGDGVGSNVARVFVGLEGAGGEDVLADVLAFAVS